MFRFSSRAALAEALGELLPALHRPPPAYTAEGRRFDAVLLDVLDHLSTLAADLDQNPEVRRVLVLRDQLGEVAEARRPRGRGRVDIANDNGLAQPAGRA